MTRLKLYLISHHLPVKAVTEPAILFYRTVARLHGYRLERRGTDRIVFV